MSFVRRLALGLLTVALLAGAAVAAGYAMRIQSGSGESTAVEAPYAAPAPAPEGSPRPRPAPQVHAPGHQSAGHLAAAPRSGSSTPAARCSPPATRATRCATCRPASRSSRGTSATSTATYGDETVEAVRGFQDKRGIAVTGRVDQRTHDRLYAMTTDPSRDQLGLHNIPGRARRPVRDRPGDLRRQDQPDPALDDRRRGAQDASTSASAARRRRPGRVRSPSATRAATTSRSSTARSMPFAMFFSGGQAVHYSSDFAAVGYDGASHGCVNVRDYEGVAWLFDQVAIGDKVVVYWS